MAFTGFGEAVVDFYEGLEADNSKAYWTDNKALYDDHVRAPMLALLADLEPEPDGSAAASEPPAAEPDEESREKDPAEAGDRTP